MISCPIDSCQNFQFNHFIWEFPDMYTRVYILYNIYDVYIVTETKSQILKIHKI